MIADDAFERAIRKSTPQRRAIFLRAERRCDPQRIRELCETEVGKRCRGCREAELVHCTSRADWSDVGGNVGECAELSKCLDSASLGSRTAPAGSMNRDRKTSQCSDPQERTWTSRCGVVNRVQIEHGAKETSLTGDRLQARARVSGGLPDAHEKAPVNKDLPRSTVARIAKRNVERLVRSG